MSESGPENVVSLLDFREEILAQAEQPDALIEAWMCQEVLSEEDRAAITAAVTSTDQMRALFHTVDKGSPQTKHRFYLLLKEKEPVIVTQLEQRCHKNKVREVEATSAEAELRKTHLVKTMRMSRRQEAELMRLQKEMEQDANSHVKWSNFQLWRKARDLDRRLERAVRERDELDVQKIKVSRQREELRCRMEDFVGQMVSAGRVKDGMEVTMGELGSTREEMQCTQKEARQNQEQVKRYVELLKNLKLKVNSWIEKENPKRALVKDYVQQNADATQGNVIEHEEYRKCLQVQREMHEETMSLHYDNETEMNEQQIKAIEAQIAQLLNEEETVRGQIMSDMGNMQKLDDKKRMTKKDMQEKEALKVELAVQRRESELAFRKAARKQAELQNIWNQIREEKDLLRRESNKKKRELEQRLERTLRERDELEMAKLRVQRQRDELSGEVEALRREKQAIQNQLALIQQHEERERRAEMGNAVYVKEFVHYFQNVIKNLDKGLERISMEITEVLKGQVEVLCKNLERKCQEIETGKSQINQEKQQLQQIRSELFLRRQVDGQKNTEEDYVAQTGRHLDSAREDIRKQNNGTLDMDRLKLQNNQEQMDTELKTRQGQLNTLRKQLRGFQQKMTTLQACTENMDTMQQQVSALSQDRAEIGNSAQRLERQWDSIEKELFLIIGQKEQLVLERQPMDTLRLQRLNLDKEKDQMDQEKGKMQEMRTHVQETERHQMEGISQEIETAKSVINDKNLQLQANRSMLQSEAGKLQIRKMEVEKHNEEEELDKEKEQVNSLMKDLDRRREEADTTLRFINEEKHQLEDNRRKSNIEREQLKVLMKEVNKKRKESEATMRLIKVEKEKLYQLRMDQTMKTQKLERQQAALKEQEEEAQSAREQAEIIYKDLDAAWKEIGEQRQQLSLKNNHLDIDRQKLQQRQEQMDTELKARQRQIQTVKNQLRGLLQQKMTTLQVRIHDMDALKRQVTALSSNRGKGSDCTQLLARCRDNIGETLSFLSRQNQQLALEQQRVDKLRSEMNQTCSNKQSQKSWIEKNALCFMTPLIKELRRRLLLKINL
uniref:CARD domain-containing protein n=1 Tax=Knipowitschia caucasica TaxID=637954 RepID=A0AAV2JEL1_KNICA